MGYYFPIILLLVTVFVVIVSAFSLLLTKSERAECQGSAWYKPVKYCREFFWVILVVFIIRSFLVQLYIVPTGSLEPTVLPGDFILASESYYGIRFPVWHFQLFPVFHPKRGQIMLFRDPTNPKVMLIKRVVGLPGDKISYIHKILYVNSKMMPQKYLGRAEDVEGQQKAPVKKYQENLDGVIHDIYINPKMPETNFYNLVVPKNHYFAMGDNRDNSDDSRYWGFVPKDAISSKGSLIFMSWDSKAKSFLHKIRWGRIGTLL